MSNKKISGILISIENKEEDSILAHISIGLNVNNNSLSTATCMRNEF